MGKKSEYPGVEIRPNGQIRIFFRYAGKPCKEPLDLQATPANIRHASRLVEEIRLKIRAGNFDYGHYFPKRAASKNVAQYGDAWLALQTHLAESTWRSYAQSIKSILKERLGLMPAASVTPSIIGTAFEEHGWESVKARNNALTPIRGVFDLVVADRVLETNPAAFIKFGRHQQDEPDPLTLDEAEAVIGWMAKNRHPQTANYFEVAMFAGPRPSEEIALEWPDTDFRRGTFRIQRAQVLGNIKPTKTYSARDVEMTDRVRATLERQKQYTLLAGGRIFLDPLTDRHYVNDKPPRLHWNAALRSLGIRARVAYQTRHTFATLALMAGANPMWVARQMGHKNMGMLLKVYARWIQGADQGRELAKLNAAIGEHAGNRLGNKTHIPD